MAYLRKFLLIAGAGAIALVICAPAEAKWGKGPSLHQARKDAGNVVRAVHHAFSSIHFQAGPGAGAGGGSKMREGEDNGINKVWGPSLIEMLQHMTTVEMYRDYTWPPYNGPTIEQAWGPGRPWINPGCLGLNCEGPVEPILRTISRKNPSKLPSRSLIDRPSSARA